MQNIFEFFKTDKKALIFSKYREGEKLNFKDYIWLLKNAFFYELPKAFILGFPSGIGNFFRNIYLKKTLKNIKHIKGVKEAFITDISKLTSFAER